MFEDMYTVTAIDLVKNKFNSMLYCVLYTVVKKTSFMFLIGRNTFTKVIQGTGDHFTGTVTSVDLKKNTILSICLLGDAFNSLSV